MTNEELQQIKELRDKRIEFAQKQLNLDRLEINLDKTKRYILERESEIILDIRRNNPNVSEQELTAELTNRLSKNVIAYRRLKYHERLRRRAAKLLYEQSLLSAEIEYLTAITR
jgi:hypothetical protein